MTDMERECVSEVDAGEGAACWELGARIVVIVVGPGRPCLACCGGIDPNRIRSIESLSAERPGAGGR